MTNEKMTDLTTAQRYAHIREEKTCLKLVRIPYCQNVHAGKAEV